MIALLAALFAVDSPPGLTPRAFFGDEPFDRPLECVGAPFPTPPQPLLTDFVGAWYLKHLNAAHELSLNAGQTPRSTWRFTWLRSFHAPVVVRIEQTSPARMRLTAKRLSGKGGYDPGGVAETIERWLTPAEQERILAAALQVQALETRDCSLKADGVRWIFESTVEGRRRMVDANSPGDGPLHDLGTVFLDLTGWPLEPRY